MRRQGAAFLLLALFSFSLISPVVLAESDVDSKLPPCCRRAGAHQCAMAGEANSNSPSIHTAPCAQFPGVILGTTEANVALPRSTFGAHHALTAALFSIPEISASNSTWLPDTSHLRGPPFPC